MIRLFWHVLKFFYKKEVVLREISKPKTVKLNPGDRIARAGAIIKPENLPVLFPTESLPSNVIQFPQPKPTNTTFLLTPEVLEILTKSVEENNEELLKQIQVNNSQEANVLMSILERIKHGHTNLPQSTD